MIWLTLILIERPTAKTLLFGAAYASATHCRAEIQSIHMAPLLARLTTVTLVHTDVVDLQLVALFLFAGHGDGDGCR
jgi:hypothetical protein